MGAPLARLNWGLSCLPDTLVAVTHPPTHPQPTHTLHIALPCAPCLQVVFIGRLDYQKGPDLMLEALPFLANLDCRVSRGGGLNVCGAL